MITGIVAGKEGRIRFSVRGYGGYKKSRPLLILVIQRG